MIRALTASVHRPTYTTPVAEREDLASTEIGTEAGQRPQTDARRVQPVEAGEKTQATTADELSPEEEREVSRLEKRDAEVRRHEMAHAAAGGQHAGAASYGYETGPDGRRYAVDGEVSIDTSAVAGDPKATIAKMEQIARAAMAPASPSGQDHRVAASARAKAAKARAELSKGEPDEERAEASGARGRGVAAYERLSETDRLGSTLDVKAD